PIAAGWQPALPRNRTCAPDKSERNEHPSDSAMLVKRVVVRVYLGSPSKKNLSLGEVPIGRQDHASVEKKVCVLRSLRQGFFHFSGGSGEFTISIKRPRQGVVRKYAMPNLQVFARPL